MTIVTLLTDFGTADSYVAEMKGVLLTYAPTATLVDISHEVSPGDVRSAKYILSRAWMLFPEGTVYVAVVDAGVGTDRRVLGATRFGRYFLAPDSGLLSFLSLNATLISNVSPSALEPDANIRVGGVDVGPLRRTFADVASGALVAFTGSGGTVEIAVRDGSAMRLLGLSVGAEVRA